MSSRLGNYQLLERLGHAGLVVTFKARHEESGAAALLHAFVPKGLSRLPENASLETIACGYGPKTPEFGQVAAEMRAAGAMPPWEVFAIGLAVSATNPTRYIVTAMPQQAAALESWLRGLQDRVGVDVLGAPDGGQVLNTGGGDKAGSTDMFGIATRPRPDVVPDVDNFSGAAAKEPPPPLLTSDIEREPVHDRGAFTHMFAQADEPKTRPIKKMNAEPVAGESSVTRFFATLSREGVPSKLKQEGEDPPEVKSVRAFGAGVDSAPNARVSEFTRQFGLSFPEKQEPQSQRLGQVQRDSGTGMFGLDGKKSERLEPRTEVEAGRKSDAGEFTDFWRSGNKTDPTTGLPVKAPDSPGSPAEPVSSPDWDTHRFSSGGATPVHVETFRLGPRHQDWVRPRSESEGDASAHEPSLDNLLRSTDIPVPLAPTPAAGSHEATKLFQSPDGPTARQNPVASERSEYTEIIQRDRLRELNELAAPAPPAPQAAPAQPHFPPMGLPPNPIGISSSGVSASAPPTPQYPLLYPPSLPTLSTPALTVPSESGDPRGKMKTGYLPLILILNGLFVLAVLVVLYFLLKRH